MSKQDLLTTAEVRSLFTREIEQMGGTVRDAYDDGARLFLRSVLPATRDVRRNDRMQSGVALRMDAAQIGVHPYLFRLVCKNGAIWAHALQTVRIDYRAALSPEWVEVRLRDTIRACGSKEAFDVAVGEMRTTLDKQADVALNMMPLLSRLPPRQAQNAIAHIMGEYHRAEDRSLFGLMNAITAVARETADPETRWNLEEYGGGIPALLPFSPQDDRDGVERCLELAEAMLQVRTEKVWHERMRDPENNRERVKVA